HLRRHLFPYTTLFRSDVRVLAATNINIQEAIANKTLREDLYYRLNAFTMQIPPLRERREEIPLLLKHFMNRLSERYAHPPLSYRSEEHTSELQSLAYL